MIKSLKFENFRGFTELKISPLPRINLIAGANNTGKTGILEGLYLLWNNPQQFAQLPLVFRSSSNPVAGQAGSDDFITFWQSLIYDRKDELLATIVAEAGTNKMIHCEIRTDKNRAIELNHHELRKDSKKRTVSRQQGLTQILPTCEVHGSPNPFARNLIVLSTHVENPVRDADLYNQLVVRGGGEERLIQLLKEIDPRLEKLRYVKAPGTSQPLVYAYFGLENAVSMNQTGQGFSKLFSLFCRMILADAKVLLIDEIENGLYYEAMPDIWRGIATLAAAADIQVFATTHSRECIIAAHETLKTMPSYDFALHRLQRVNGRIEAITHDQGMLEVAIKSGREVR